MTYLEASLLEGTLFEMYKSKGLTKVEEALVEAIDNINKRILATNGDWTKSNLTKIKNSIIKEISQSYLGLDSFIVDEVSDVAIFVAAMYSVPKSVVEDLITKNTNVLGYTISELFNASKDSHIKALRTELATNVAQGSSLPRIIASIKRKNLSKVNNLRTAVYTTIKQSRETTRTEVYKTLDIDKWEFVATLDFSTSSVCRSNDNKIFTGSYNDIKVKPPLHFNCRSIIIPYNDSEKQQRASIFGQVDNISYRKWFSNLPSQIQRKVLGSNKYKLYSEGRLDITTVKDLKQNKFDLQELKEIYRSM